MPKPINKLQALVPEYERRTLSSAQIKRSIAGSDLDPLTLMLAVVRDETLPVNLRMDAAKGALPYTHQRKPLALEGTDKPFVISADELRALSRNELVLMQGLLAKMGVSLAEHTQSPMYRENIAEIIEELLEEKQSGNWTPENEEFLKIF